jgi:hypothetical protein
MAVTGQPPAPTDEHVRLRQSAGDGDPWRLWGPYVSGRQWGTVREDYSAERRRVEVRSPLSRLMQRTYRWGEDGMAGLSPTGGASSTSPIALWNGQ